MKNLINHFEEYVIALLLAGMTIMTGTNVFFRYVLESSIGWSFELTTFMFAWLIFLGAAWGVRVGAHIGVDVFVKKLPLERQRFLAITASLLCMLYAALICYGASVYVNKIMDVGLLSQDIEWLPQWIPRAVMPFSFALIFIRFAQVLVRLIQRKQYNIELVDEAQEAIDAFAPSSPLASGNQK
jgi:C4-dicarboxylate transporter DctQ subunit